MALGFSGVHNARRGLMAMAGLWSFFEIPRWGPPLTGMEREAPARPPPQVGASRSKDFKPTAHLFQK